MMHFWQIFLIWYCISGLIVMLTMRLYDNLPYAVWEYLMFFVAWPCFAIVIAVEFGRKATELLLKLLKIEI